MGRKSAKNVSAKPLGGQSSPSPESLACPCHAPSLTGSSRGTRGLRVEHSTCAPCIWRSALSAALRKVSRAQSAGLPVVGSFSLLGKIRARQRPWFSLSVCGFCSSNPSPWLCCHLQNSSMPSPRDRSPSFRAALLTRHLPHTGMS